MDLISQKLLKEKFRNFTMPLSATTTPHPPPRVALDQLWKIYLSQGPLIICVNGGE